MLLLDRPPRKINREQKSNTVTIDPELVNQVAKIIRRIRDMPITKKVAILRKRKSPTKKKTTKQTPKEAPKKKATQAKALKPSTDKPKMKPSIYAAAPSSN
mmetsp:Transcript_14772/g.25220  ORF Transcript_14772/g.25220 Transcript_14772/m.25220 type:complete len:101 (+) Transcript_14772:333-635(+)